MEPPHGSSNNLREYGIDLQRVAMAAIPMNMALNSVPMSLFNPFDAFLAFV
jgi:hypothetical protein